jgi:hypothetical protein
VPGTVPSATRLGLPTSTEEVRDFVRRAAVAHGIDPDIAVRVVISEGGLSPAGWVGDNNSSFGPLQLHYGGVASGGNAVSGLGDEFTRRYRVDARDPSTWRQQIEYSFVIAASQGWGAWHGAERVGIGARDGLQASRAVARTAAAPTYQTAVLRPHVSVPNQFDAALSLQDGYSACGPAAAVAVAHWLGRNANVPEVLEIARQVGWTRDGGMNGIGNEKRLLDKMGVPAHIETPIDWRHIRADAFSGNPVILSSPGHYWVIDDYNPSNRTYHVGQSGLAYAGGAEWMTGEQIQALGGQPSGALYVDHPLIPQPSVAVHHAPPAAALVVGGAPVRDTWWQDVTAQPAGEII